MSDAVGNHEDMFSRVAAPWKLHNANISNVINVPSGLVPFLCSDTAVLLGYTVVLLIFI